MTLFILFVALITGLMFFVDIDVSYPIFFCIMLVFLIILDWLLKEPRR